MEDNHQIKLIYNKKNIFNYKDYINHLKKLTNDKENKFKFSIIYTFTNIISNIEGINENNSLQLISEIKRENNLIDLINEKKYKSKGADNNFFIMHFYQYELDKLNFIISTLNNNYADEEIKFIFIVHIKRIMDKKKKEKIYSIPDIDEKVDQIFIDNLNGLNISLDSIAKDGIIKILENKELVDKNTEFFKALKAYYNTYTDKISFIIENYLPKVIDYFKHNKEFIDLIVSKALYLIGKESKKNVKEERKENIETFNKIKEEIFNDSYITQNTVDIVSLIINDIIIEKRLRGTIMQIIDALESNNFLSTLLTLDNITQNKSFTSKENLYQIMDKYLNSMKITKIQNKATFQSNYLVPGLLSFYDTISNFISKNITEKFFKNEKKLRDSLKGNIQKLQNDFHSEEAKLLDIVSEEINTDESDNYKFINEIKEKCPIDLLLNDYINYFLNKNNDNIYIVIEDFSENESNISNIENDEEEKREEEIDDFNLKIIKQILELKYKKETKIIIDNIDDEFKKLLIKIIWLEANKNYIFTIIQLFNEAKNKIYKNKNRNMLLEQVSIIISNNKVKYMPDENRNHEHTKEVKECYYKLLASICYSITLDEIKLIE